MYKHLLLFVFNLRHMIVILSSAHLIMLRYTLNIHALSFKYSIVAELIKVSDHTILETYVKIRYSYFP